MGKNLLFESPHAASARSPIAIVGIGCRFPGGVKDPDSFWRLLQDSVDAIGEIPSSRIDVEKYYDSRLATRGKMASRWGGFLDNIDAIDADFFGISPLEAERMDPQQRLLLEVAWEAIEDAGHDLSRLDRTSAGVFVGLWLNDFEGRLFADPASVDFHMTTGSGRYAASGRLSYFLAFQGPSLTLDTACSSSLVAVHLACRSLWSGECNYALAGGANVILQPHISIAYSQSKMIAPDGRCKFGDSSANGYVRSEGAGIVVLKRLEDALRDGDSIYAVIQGSAVNNDGTGSGYLTTPAREGQEQLLRKAYLDAGMSPTRVQYIEAHGTGTIAGDPVEVGALGAVVGSGREASSVCYIGSVKTNFGHTEGAAGVAGLIKTALMLRHRMIPASLHLRELNPAIPWTEFSFEIPRTLQPWPEASEPAVAGVSAFGITGTNAHIVLSEAPVSRVTERGEEEIGNPYLLPISARSPEALLELANSFGSVLENEKAPALSDVAFTAALRRNHHEYRLAAVATTKSESSELLRAFARGENVPGIWTGRADPEKRHKVVFVCPGQGSQWVGMGRQLIREERVFTHALQECEDAMRPYVDWSLREQLALSPEDPKYRLDEIDVIQPCLAAIEIALAALWRSWGVNPDAIVGHSMGEVAAAFLSGSLDLNDAMRVICARSRLLRTVRGKGAMAVVALPFEEAEKSVAKFRDSVSAAVSNSPRSTVLSGDPVAIANILEDLQTRNIFCRLVKVDVASHSPQMDSLMDSLRESVKSIRPRKQAIPIYSTVTAGKIQGPELHSDYWAQNLRSPVRFSKVIRKLAEEGHTIFIELSPHPILLPSIEETLHDVSLTGQTVPSLERDKDERMTMLGALGRLYTVGFPIDWSLQFPKGGQHVRLPSYPWQRRQFWMETKPQNAGLLSGSLPGTVVHPLLGIRMPAIANLPDTTIWQTRIDQRFLKLLRPVTKQENADVARFESSEFAAIASAAAEATFGKKLIGLSHVVLHRKQLLTGTQETQFQFILKKSGSSQGSLEIFSSVDGTADNWQRCATGTLSISDAESDWLYETEWKEKPIPLDACSTERSEKGTWVIFADRQGIGSALAAELRSRGQECAVVSAGESFRRDSDLQFRASASNREHIDRLFEALREGGKSCCGIVYLWTIDAENSLEESVTRNCDGALNLVQSIGKSSWKTPPRVWFVTQNAQAVTPGDAASISLGQTPLWGWGRVVALENPELFGGLLDLPLPASATQTAEQLCAELLNSDGEDQVALRGKSRRVLRLVRSGGPRSIHQEVAVAANATYLVTGGVGGLGLQLAAWLVEKGATNLVLTSRKGLPDRSAWNSFEPTSEIGARLAAVKRMEAAGAKVAVVKADVANKADLARLWKAMQDGHPPLRGIIHAAGVAKARPLMNTSSEDANEILRPKVEGSWNLHQLVADSRSLDFFVMFSSAAALFGAQDMGPYAAANHFMDGLASYRRAHGLPALCINWGWWDSRGLVSDEMATVFRRTGLKPMGPESALSVFSYLLNTNAERAMVADIDWEVFRPVFEARRRRPLLESIPGASQGESGSSVKPEAAGSVLLKELERASDAEKQNLLRNFIRAQVAQILGFKSPDGVSLQLGFFRMGMDSMMTVQLRTRLEGNLNCSLPPTIAFEYPTVHSLADFIAHSVLKMNGTATVEPVPVAKLEPVTVEPREELSEEQLEDLLAKKLEQIQ